MKGENKKRMRNDKLLFIVRQPIFVIVTFVAPLALLLMATIGLASQGDYYGSKTYAMVSVFFIIPLLISQTYHIKVYEDRLIRRFMFRDVVVRIEDIESAHFTLGRFGDEWFDINTNNKRIRIHTYSINTELLIGWLKKHGKTKKK